MTKTANGLFSIVIIAFVLSLTGCGDPTPPSSDTGKPRTVPQKTEPSVSRQSSSRAWPFPDEGADGNLAANMLAKNYVLVYDGSGSMSDVRCSDHKAKIVVAREAVAAWVKTVPAEANLGLVAFHNSEWTIRPIEHGRRDNFIQAVLSIDNGGNTPLGEALGKAYAMITEQGKKQLGYGEYTIVTITDGEANDSEPVYDLKTVVNKILKTSPITIWSIGFCIEGSHSLNQPGRTLYKAANNPQELSQGLREVIAESEIFDISSFR